MTAVPLTRDAANEMVKTWHRHHKPVVGYRFAIGAKDEKGKLVGAVIVGRPVARMVDQYSVAEVTRLVTDGTRNACSFLYGRAATAAKAMGFLKIQTYTLPEEGGASLRGPGWVCDGVVRKDGRGWTSREGRREDQPTTAKLRWHKVLA